MCSQFLHERNFDLLQSLSIFCMYISEDLLALFHTSLQCIMMKIYEYVYLLLFALRKNRCSLGSGSGSGIFSCQNNHSI